MVKTKKTTKKKLKGFTKSTTLDKYANKALFAEKVKKANHILKTVGLPKD